MPRNAETMSEEFYAAADQVAAHYEADTLLYSGPIDSIGYAETINAVLERSQRKNCLLVLTTSGGDLNVAYQIARFLHRKYARLILCSPRFCKSAGTLIALGAHKLLVDEYSEFGPIDTSAAEPSEGGGHVVGATECFEWVTNNTVNMFEAFMPRFTTIIGSSMRPSEVARLSLLAITELMRPAIPQINVMAAGAKARSMKLAEVYGLRLAKHACNMREGAVHSLMGRYPSHDFIIDYAEIRTLFTHVELPSEPLYKMLNLLGEQVYEQSQTAVVRRVHPSRSSRTATEAQTSVGEVLRQPERTSGTVVANMTISRRAKPKASSTNDEPGIVRRVPPAGRKRRRRPPPT
jgi:hypothetical protein